MGGPAAYERAFFVTQPAHNRKRPKRDRREFGRFETRLSVATVREDLGPDGASRCRLNLEDFSLGGLRATSPVRLKVDERVRLRFGANSHHPPLVLTGRVRYCRRLEDRYRVGVEFSQTDTNPATSPYRQLPRFFSLAHRGEQDAKPFEALKQL